MYKKLGEIKAKKVFSSVKFKILTMWEYYLLILIGMLVGISLNVYYQTSDRNLIILKGIFTGLTIGVIIGGSMTTLTYRYIVKNGLFKE